MLQIVFKDEGGERVEHPLVPGRPITVGRGAQAELRIRNASISRAHAKIWDSGGAWFVQDLGSSNFTFVNGEKVDKAPFGEGDVVRFGDFSVRIQDDGESGGRGRRAAPEAAPSRSSRAGDVEAEEDLGGRSRRARPSAVEDEPVSRRPRPSAVEDEPVSRRPRPSAVEDEPVSRRARPSAVEDEPISRRPRPSAVEDEPVSRRSRPSAVEDEPRGRRPRPGAMDDDDDDGGRSRRARPSLDDEPPARSRAREPEPEPPPPVVPRREAPAARSGGAGVDPAQLRAAQERANKLEEDLRDARAALDAQLGRIEELEQRESRFDSETAGWNDRYNKAREQLDHNQELLRRAKEDNREHEATITAFEREVADLEAQLQQLEASREGEAGLLSDLKSKVVQKDRRIDELQRELDLMEFDLRNARDELESIQDSMNLENTEQRKLERELALLREVINEKENVVKELQIEIEEQEREIYDLKMGTGVKDLEAARADMLEKYFEKNREAEDLRKKLSAIEKKFAQMEDELNEYEEKLSESKDISQHPDFQRKTRELERAISDAEEMREEHERLQKKLEQFGPESKAKLDAELNFMRRKNQALEEKLESLAAESTDRASSSAELTFARKKAEALEEKVSELEAKVEEANSEAATARRDAEQARRDAEAAASAAPAAPAAPSVGAGESTAQSSTDAAIRVDAAETVEELVELYGSWRSNISLLKSYVDDATEVIDTGEAPKASIESINEVLTVILADAGDMRRELKSLQSLLAGD